MILIILPVKNEEKTVKETALNLYGWCKENIKEPYEILFINDQSTDKTQEIISSLKNEKIKIIKNKFDNGKGSALKAGFVMSDLIYRLNDNDKIVFMDGDGQIEPKEIKAFLTIMHVYDADVVIGNKRHTFSNTSYSFSRKIVSLIYNMITRLLFGIKYDDTQCGIKIFYKCALDRVIGKITVKNFAFDLELIVALKQMKMRVADAPVNIKEQLNSGSVSLKNIFKTFIDTMCIYKRLIKGHYKGVL